MTRPPSSPTPTVAPRCLPGLTFPDFYETKREVWLLRTGFCIAPVNKLVSLTWLLWAVRSFRSFTLHYYNINNNKQGSYKRLPKNSWRWGVVMKSCPKYLRGSKICLDWG